MADGDPIIIGQDNDGSNPGNATGLWSTGPWEFSAAFYAVNQGLGYGLKGDTFDDTGESAGVKGTCSHGIGVEGICFSHGAGVKGTSTTGAVGVEGTSNTGAGVRGTTRSGFASGVSGFSGGGWGVIGGTNSGQGVMGFSNSTGIGVSGQAAPNSGKAGYFNGGITIVNGLKPFTIDHPLDPQNKYLVHTSVESSEMKNVYDGGVHLDEDGAAWVELPEWFEALNGYFRYQLTAVGGSAPNLHVAEEVSENRFKIAGGEEGLKVCWQVTGTRKDPWAAANTFEVEQEKPEEEQGRYLDPSVYDAPEEQRVMMGPLVEAVEEEHRREIDELSRLEEKHRREMEELRERLEERQEEAPPEST